MKKSPSKKSSAAKVICLTGGPCAGKTSVTDIIRRQFAKELLVVPESATILYRGGFPRAFTPQQMKCVQEAIFHVQVASEEYFKLQPGKLRGLICDRGTLDGAAYWPGLSKEFFKKVGTSVEKEIARYDVVIHMETATENNGYDSSNSLRTESAREAVALDKKIQAAWASHPARFVVNHRSSFIEKVEEVLAILRRELPGGL